jgi:hypothetical protein
MKDFIHAQTESLLQSGQAVSKPLANKRLRRQPQFCKKLQFFLVNSSCDRYSESGELMNFIKTLGAFLIGGLLIVGLAEPSLAAKGTLDEAQVARELRGLTESINNLARLLERDAGNENRNTSLRKLDIAIAYLNFRSRRIELFERDLQSSRATRNRLEDALEQFQRESESLSQVFDTTQRDAMQRAQEELSLRRQAIKDRISRMDEEIILLENRIMDMQSQIDSVESFVEKNLAF